MGVEGKWQIWEGCPEEVTFDLDLAGWGRLFFPERSGGEQPRQKDQYAQKYSGMMSVAYIENCMGQVIKGLC